MGKWTHNIRMGGSRSGNGRDANPIIKNIKEYKNVSELIKNLKIIIYTKNIY